MKEGPGDRSGVHVGHLLKKRQRSLVRHAERSIVALDMCISDFGVLEMLLHKGPQSVSEIGRRVELTSGSITTAIDRLEQRGLVARAAHASDRRARVVDLTPDGKALITLKEAENHDHHTNSSSPVCHRRAREGTKHHALDAAGAGG